MTIPKRNLVTRVYSTNLIDEIKFICAIMKSKLTKANFPLNLTVQVDNVKYHLIDFESLCIISPNFESYMNDYLSFKEGNVFIDVGAHIGKYSLRAAKDVGSSGKVISIEADPSTFEALEEGINANHYKNVITFNSAAYNYDGLVDFFVAPNQGISPNGYFIGKGGSSIKRPQDGNKNQVPARTIDSIMGELKLTKVNYIKIDAEGAEIEILQGAKKTIIKHRPTLIIEAVDTQEQMRQFFADLNYSVTNIAPCYFCIKPN